VKPVPRAFWPRRDVGVPRELADFTFEQLREREDFNKACRVLRNRRKKLRQACRSRDS
jgi:hypothetical protein